MSSQAVPSSVNEAVSKSLSSSLSLPTRVEAAVLLCKPWAAFLIFLLDYCSHPATHTNKRQHRNPAHGVCSVGTKHSSDFFFFFSDFVNISLNNLSKIH